ncbi:hypothetical protein [Cytophaga aurantiaca]|uniref:hypothetical protein n=1 Tax=Cytophaga aurantiaca TaxID=29530 RepID=UPI00035FDA6D|nr:hypothetical protein [Cytophaga aurantiaca]
MMYKNIVSIKIYLILFFFITVLKTQAQCEFTEVLRADGSLNRNYEYDTIFLSDSMNIDMSLSFQGALRTLRVEFEYNDTLKARSYKDIYLQLEDSTIVEMQFLSSSKELANGKTTCLYDINKRDLGFLERYKIVYFIYNRKNNTRATLLLTTNQDILIKQLECVRKK